jgi:hypothetical protein
MFKKKMDIDRHGPRPMPNNCKNFNPPTFSLPTTFNNRQCFQKNVSENFEIETKKFKHKAVDDQTKACQ